MNGLTRASFTAPSENSAQQRQELDPDKPASIQHCSSLATRAVIVSSEESPGPGLPAKYRTLLQPMSIAASPPAHGRGECSRGESDWCTKRPHGRVRSPGAIGDSVPAARPLPLDLSPILRLPKHAQTSGKEIWPAYSLSPNSHTDMWAVNNFSFFCLFVQDTPI